MATEREEVNRTLGFTANDEELEIFDQLQQKYYALSKSAILRKVFAEGAKRILNEKKS